MKLLIIILLIHALWIPQCFALQPFILASLSGGLETETLDPTSNSATHDTWTFQNGSVDCTNWADDTESTQAFSSTANDKQACVHEDLSSLTSVNYVDACVTSVWGADGADLRYYITDGTNDTAVTDVTLTSSYVEDCFRYTTAPDGGAWTVDDVSNSEVVVENLTTTSSFVTKTYLKVFGGSAIAAPTYLHNVLMDDDAASTVVSNDGTGAAWTASETTDGLNSPNAPSGYTDSFYFDSSSNYIYSGEVVTAEQFEVIWYVRHDNATASAREMHFQLGDSDANIEANEIFVKRDISTDEWRICVYGNSGVSECDSSTNYNPGADTWYKITLNVDASTTPWTISMFRDITELEWDDGTPWGSSEAAVFNINASYGDAGGDTTASYIAGLTFEDTTP